MRIFDVISNKRSRFDVISNKRSRFDVISNKPGTRGVVESVFELERAEVGTREDRRKTMSAVSPGDIDRSRPNFAW